MAMNEATEPLTGKDAVEAAQGYRPMPVYDPVKAAEPEFGTDDAVSREDELRALSIVMTSDRVPSDSEKPIIVREYLDNQTGKPMPENETLSAEQASHDLSRSREATAEAEQTNIEAEIAAAIDRLRAGDEQQAPPVTEQQEPAPQPKPNAQLEGDDPVASALENPAVLAAVENEVARRAALHNSALEQYANATAQNALAAGAALVRNFPELSALNHPSQIPTAIAVVAQQNPQRAQEMLSHIRAVDGLVNEVKAARQQQAAHLQQQFSDWAAVNDQHFDKWAAKQATRQEIEAVKAETWNMLREAGMNEEQIRGQWNANPMMRSLAAQQTLWNAARYRLAQKGAKSKAAPQPMPKMQRPGSPVERAADDDVQLRDLSRNLDRSMSVKDAAALLVARRARAQRR